MALFATVDLKFVQCFTFSSYVIW